MIVKRFFAYIAVLTSIVSVFSSCSEKPEEKDDPEPVSDTRSLELTLSTAEIGWEGGQFSLQVKANFEYRVEISADWVAIDGSVQDSDKIKYFTAEMNPYNESRSAEIRVIDVKDKYYFKAASVSQEMNPAKRIEASIVDKNATPETKALFANLFNVGEKGFMFGHHDDLWYGRYWYNEPGRSDTKDVCGDYPAVFSVDFGEITDNRYTNGENQIRRRVIIEAYERGEVILAVMHLNNPQTGGDAWDNSKNDVVKNILTEGSSVRTKYLGWLDHLAEFANNLKDSNGTLIPVILRPYHEHTQWWSWWSQQCTTEEEFINLWRMTVKYLRDTKGVHNFLYAISPQMDSWYSESEASGRIVFRWPGDEWVDFMGIDCYHGENPAAMNLYLDALESWAVKKNKPCGVTEDGRESFTTPTFWSKEVLEPLRGRRSCMCVMWRNKYVGNNESDKHYYSVYPGHPSEEDFVKMYNDPESIFSRDLPDMYAMPENCVIK